MKFNHLKLLGRMKEKGITQAQLALNINIALTTLNQKINGSGYFTTSEIHKICKVLDIMPKDVGIYFFAN